MIKFFRRLYWNRRIVGDDHDGYSASSRKATMWCSNRENLLSYLSEHGL